MLRPRRRLAPPGRLQPVLLAGLLSLTPTVTQGAGIDDFVGRPVHEVLLVSDGRPIDDESMLDLVETRLYAPLSMQQVRESLTHLFSLGRYDGVRVDASLHPEGVALRYELVPIRLIERVRFEGELGLPEGELRLAITDAHGASFRPEAVPAVADTLRLLFRARGFFNAVVEPRLLPSDELVVDVRSGARARIGQLSVRGISFTMSELVLDRLGIREGLDYDGSDVERRLVDYETELRERQYYEASLGHDVEVSPDGTRVDLLVDVRQGPRITVVFAGDTVPAADPAVLVPIAREASVDEDLLEDSERRIASHLRAQGFRDAEVRHTRRRAADELAIVFTADRGRPYEVAEVAITGNDSMPLLVLEPLIGFGIGAPFSETVLENSVAAIAEHYFERGFPTVLVEPVVSEIGERAGTVLVRCEIVITEGPRTEVRSVSIVGNESWSAEVLAAVVRSTEGGAYDSRLAVEGGDALRLVYLNDGYEEARVATEVSFDDDLRYVEITYRVFEGSQVVVEHILVVGNDRVRASTIRGELAINEGAPLGLAGVAETRRRLNALGLFRRVDLREFSHGAGDRRDVIVEVDEAPATRVGYGGGLEVAQRLRRDGNDVSAPATERLEFAPRGFFEIGRRNLWGRNRSIDLFTRVSLRRKNDPIDPELAGTDTSSLGFNEYRVLATYREPRTFGLQWDIFVDGFVEQAIRSGFDLFSRGLNVQINRQLSSTLLASMGYGLGQNNTSNKQLNPEDEPLVDRLFPEVRLSSFTGSLLRDTRDDPFDPRGGTVLGVDGELAARAIGSEVGFAKTYASAFIYRTLPGTSRVVVAGGARVGMAVGFPRVSSRVEELLPLPPGAAGDEKDTIIVMIEEELRTLPISERFFAGGDVTVRGFALDRLGEPIGEPGGTIDQDGFPQGGNAMLIFNGELRVPVTRDIGVVGFLDVGNVYDRVGSMRLTRLRGGAGFGVRYRSPVGPIRVDLGFKLDQREFGSGENTTLEPRTALHITIGQAF